MALFKKDTKETEKKTTKKAETALVPAEKSTKTEKKDAKTAPAIAGVVGGVDLSRVLVRPHVTEKATDLAEGQSVYAFEVHNDANKAQVKLAVEKLYKVTPTKVAILVRKPKYTVSRSTNRKVVKKHAFKKALIYLKKGEKIEFV